MKRLVKLITLALLLCSLHASGQSNFVPGYVISLNHDTVRGFIERRLEENTFKACTFKKDMESKAEDLQPMDYLGYCMEDKTYYESLTIKEKKGGLFSGFFNVLVKGELALLRAENRYFARDESGALYEITATDEMINGQANANHIAYGLLKYLMRKCPKAVPDQEQFTNSRFKGIFLAYNDCVGSHVTQPSQIKKKLVLIFGLMYSQGSTGVTFNNREWQSASLAPKSSMAMGGYFSLFVPGISDRIRFRLEAFYGSYSGGTTFDAVHSVFGSYYRSVDDITVNYSYLRIPLLLKLNIQKFYIEFGPQIQLIMSQDLTWKQQRIYVDNSIRNYNMIPVALDGVDTGYIVGLGRDFKIKQFSFSTSFRFTRVKDRYQYSYGAAYQYLEFNINIPLLNSTKNYSEFINK